MIFDFSVTLAWFIQMALGDPLGFNASTKNLQNQPGR